MEPTFFVIELLGYKLEDSGSTLGDNYLKKKLCFQFIFKFEELVGKKKIPRQHHPQ